MKIRSVGRSSKEPELLTVTFEFDSPNDSSQLMDHLYKAMKERVGVWIEYDNDPAGVNEASFLGDIIIDGETVKKPIRRLEIDYGSIKIREIGGHDE